MPRILVVDDEEEVRNVLSQFFQKKGYEVLAADSGAEALSTLERRPVDAVLLDIRMPGMDGLATLRRLKASYPAMPVVMVSGETDEEVAKAALKEGAFDYIVKPPDFAYLERTVFLKLFQALA